MGGWRLVSMYIVSIAIRSACIIAIFPITEQLIVTIYYERSSPSDPLDPAFR